MASSSLFVFFNVHTDGSKWDLRWTVLDPIAILAFFGVISVFFSQKDPTTLIKNQRF